MKYNQTYRNGRRRGLALIAVLWMVMMLTIIIAITARTVRLDSHVSRSATEGVRARWALHGGIERALAVLKEDLLDTDAFSDAWCSADENLRGIEMDGCVLDIEIIDESALLNINVATKKQLMSLEGMTEDVADAIIDWRDGNEETEAAGAEARYYQTLEVPYEIRNGYFKTIEELLLVRGVTQELFYGTAAEGRAGGFESVGHLLEDTGEWDSDDASKGWVDFLTCYSFDKNVRSSGEERINVNSVNERRLARQLGISRAQAKRIADNGDYKSVGDLISPNSPRESVGDSEKDEGQPLDIETYQRIVDDITVVDEEIIPGRLNINTAKRQVWVALLEGDEELAEAIVNYRDMNTQGMMSIGELLNVRGMTIEKYQKIADRVSPRSFVFRICCRATSKSTGAEYKLECVVERASEESTILYWYEGSRM